MNFLIQLSVILPALFMGIFSIARPPEWLQEGVLLPYWKKINIGAMALSAIASIGIYNFVYDDFANVLKVFAGFAVNMMSFLFLQTVFTDGFQRLADRRILRFANVLSAIGGLYVLYNFTNTTTIGIYILFFLCVSILSFVPAIGKSDVRALQLVVLAGFPILGITGIQTGIIIFIPLILLYGVIAAIRKKSFKGFFTKLSTPMVPLILAPFLLLLLIGW